MPLCLSFLAAPDAEVSRNHAHYAGLHGYDLVETGPGRLVHPVVRAHIKYSEILRRLRALAPDDLLIFLDGDSVILHPAPLESLMAGRESLLARGPDLGSEPGAVMSNMMIFRNTPEVRHHLHQVINIICDVLARPPPRFDETAALAPLGLLDCNAAVAGVFVNVTWWPFNWFEAPTFTAYLGPLSRMDAHGQAYGHYLHDPNLQALLARDVNAFLMGGQAPMATPDYPPVDDAPSAHVEPAAKIAFVSLYTPHIRHYGRIAEHNVRRYCARHGHGYHIYREIPAPLDPAMAGSWAKPWLLKRHLAAHEWVIWIDADMLFLDQSRAIAPLLEGRDLLFAKDLTAWPMNSGFMAFRNTPANETLLDTLCDVIARVEDKSTVYASLGDQFYICQTLEAEGLLTEANVVDNLTVNTPAVYADESTLLAHYLALSDPYRAFYMARADALSRMRDTR
jgi:hypothetical protein